MGEKLQQLLLWNSEQQHKGNYVGLKEALSISLNAESLNYRAMGLGALGYTKEAISVSEKALALYRQQLGDFHSDTATLLNNIGFAYADLREYNTAQKYHEAALEIRQKLGKSHLSDLAQTYNNLGMVAFGRANDQTAQEHISHSLSLREEILGPHHPDVSICINNLGLVALRQKNYEKARGYFENAYQIRHNAFGTREQPAVMRSYFYLASCYLHLGDTPKALEITEEVLRYRERVYDAGHPEIKQVLTQLVDLYALLSDVSQREACQKRLQFDMLPESQTLSFYL